MTSPLPRRTAALLLATLLIAASQHARAQEEGALAPLERRAHEVAALFLETPKVPDGLFHESFLAQVPRARMAGILKTYWRQGGACTSVRLLSSDSPWSGRLRLSFEKELETTMTLTIEPAEPHGIVGLFLTNLEPSLLGFEGLAKELEKLPGRVGCALALLGDGEPRLLFAHAAEEPFAIGSTFKLYVLGALGQEVLAGGRRWQDVVLLQEQWRSLPTGILQSWPTGSPITLHSLAALMISMSDNTATDHLLFVLGRERVEGLLEGMGNRHAASNRPFLSTAELFRLKGCEGGRLMEPYLALAEAERRAFLERELPPLALDSVNGGALGVPTRIQEIEWFASCADLCRALDWLARAASDERARPAREILAVNPGLPAARSFAYAGYKGGSEGGVLNQSWLLERADGARFALVASWNDPAKALDEARFFGLMGRVLGLVAELELPPAPEHAEAKDQRSE